MCHGLTRREELDKRRKYSHWIHYACSSITNDICKYSARHLGMCIVLLSCREKPVPALLHVLVYTRKPHGLPLVGTLYALEQLRATVRLTHLLFALNSGNRYADIRLIHGRGVHMKTQPKRHRRQVKCLRVCLSVCPSVCLSCNEAMAQIRR